MRQSVSYIIMSPSYMHYTNYWADLKYQSHDGRVMGSYLFPYLRMSTTAWLLQWNAIFTNKYKLQLQTVKSFANNSFQAMLMRHCAGDHLHWSHLPDQ